MKQKAEEELQAAKAAAKQRLNDVCAHAEKRSADVEAEGSAEEVNPREPTLEELDKRWPSKGTDKEIAAHVAKEYNEMNLRALQRDARLAKKSKNAVKTGRYVSMVMSTKRSQTYVCLAT